MTYSLDEQAAKVLARWHGCAGSPESSLFAYMQLRVMGISSLPFKLIFHFLWDHRAHCGIFENGVLLMYTLEGVNSVANFISAYEESQYTETAIFISVVCSLFPKAIFFTFIF